MKMKILKRQGFMKSILVFFGGEGQRERERQNLMQDPCPGQSWMGSSISQP